MRKGYLNLLFSLFTVFSFAQSGKISGKVIDSKTGETLPGATVILQGTTKGAATDLDGNYTINNISPGTYTVVCRFISYTNKALGPVIVKENEVTLVNFSLAEPTGDTLNVITVTSSLEKENTSALLIMQKNATSVSDGVSAETIKKTPDRNTSDVLRRVSGAAIQDNRFVIIRGLNDRYNAAFLNGAPLPSTESDRKAFSFDIFPANMLDNIVINKTATPDMPGEFAGGLIQINTKSIPEKNFQSFSFSGGYNSLAIGKDRYHYKGGKTDWLGFDDGTRAMPGDIPANEKDFPTLVGKQAELAKHMKNDWAVYRDKYSLFHTPNLAFQYAMGQSIKRKERDFIGTFFSLSYNRNYSYVETVRRSYTSSLDPKIPSQIDFDYLDKSYATNVLAGALANVSVKLNENHIFSFKNILSVNSDDRLIRREGTTNPLDPNPTLLRSTARWFTSNQIYSGQLGGDHYVPKAKIKIAWLGSFSAVKRDVPDLRRSVYTRLKTFNDPVDPWYQDTMYQANISNSNVGPDYGGGIFYSKLKEEIRNARTDISRSFTIHPKFKLELKSGGFYQERSRNFAARQLGYTKYGGSGQTVNFNNNLLFLPEDSIFQNQNMGLISPGVGGFKLVDATKPTDAYGASSKLLAAYFMFDARIFEFARVIAGARYENFTQKLDALYDNRKPLGLLTQKADMLPSANLIFSITQKQNVRLCYSQTLNRPEFRELAPFAFYDFNTQFLFSGYDKLLRAKITNYDVRYEFYPGRGQLISLTGFYKDFENPIEQITRADVQGEISYRNAPRANNYGLEAEFRWVAGSILKKDTTKIARILNNLTLCSNAALIRSKVILTNNSSATVKERQLQGQSPYVLNAGIIYQDNERGYSFAIMGNRVGRRIFIVGNASDPDIWENGRTVIDIQFGKTFLKNKLDVRFNIRDLLAEKFYYLPKLNNKNLKGEYIAAQQQYFYQDKTQNQKLDITKDDLIWISRFGRTISLSLTYKF